jgi:hypothetical protein
MRGELTPPESRRKGQADRAGAELTELLRLGSPSYQMYSEEAPQQSTGDQTKQCTQHAPGLVPASTEEFEIGSVVPRVNGPRVATPCGPEYEPECYPKDRHNAGYQ